MKVYVLRRLVALIPVALVVATVAFVLIHLAPGDPAAIIAGPDAPAEDVAQLRRTLGLDRQLRRLCHDDGESAGGGGIQPDLTRRKEPLEAYPLENLRMVGTLQQNKSNFALVKTPDNNLFRVKVGNYMGQNFGLITEISESTIKLKELVQDSSGDWTERVSTMTLIDESGK